MTEASLPHWLGTGVGNVYFELGGRLVQITPEAARGVLTAVAAEQRGWFTTIRAYEVRETDDYVAPVMRYACGDVFVSSTGPIVNGQKCPFPVRLPSWIWDTHDEEYWPHSGYVGIYFPFGADFTVRRVTDVRIGVNNIGDLCIGEHVFGSSWVSEYCRYIEYGCFLRDDAPEPSFTLED